MTSCEVASEDAFHYQKSGPGIEECRAGTAAQASRDRTIVCGDRIKVEVVEPSGIRSGLRKRWQTFDLIIFVERPPSESVEGGKSWRGVGDADWNSI